jgi:putative DNA primase/helicase
VGDRFQTAALDGKLMNVSNELSVQTFINDGMVKAIIAGDLITGEAKHQAPYSFSPYCRLVVATNELPLSHDVTNAFFRRWIVIPMQVETPPDEFDHDLPDRICRDELSGVFLWALAGLARLRVNNRFTSAASSTVALEAWKRGIDPVREFSHRYLIQSKGSAVPLQELFGRFNRWAKETNRRSQFTDSNLRTRFEGIGYRFTRRNYGYALVDHLLAVTEEDRECRESVGKV